MALLATQTVVLAGIVPAYVAAAAGGDTIDISTGRNCLVVKNGSGVSINVTLDSVAACDQGFDHNEVVAVAAGAEKWIGGLLLTSTRFGSVAAIAYSAVTTVTVAAMRMP